MILYQEVRSSNVANLVEKIPDVHIVFQHSLVIKKLNNFPRH